MRSQLCTALFVAAGAGADAQKTRNGTNPVFPDSTERTSIAACRSCLDNIVASTCTQSSGSPEFDSCICIGDGSTRFETECYFTCCNTRAITCAGNPWREYWLYCVDTHPTPFCAMPPNRISPEYKEHCTDA